MKRWLGSVLAAAALAACSDGAVRSSPASSVFPELAELPTLEGVGGDFGIFMAKWKEQKPHIMARQRRLLEDRYDLSDRRSPTCRTFRGTAVQTGVRAKLRENVRFRDLDGKTPEEIRDADLFPQGFLPLPHPNQPEGGMLFPRNTIDEVQRQTGRDLTRFDLEFDLPDHFLPDFPPPMFLTTRQDLGDVSRGKLITTDNFYELLDGVVPSKQLDGLRLLVTPFAQQQFNLTTDRRSERPSLGVSCFDCHVNGHTNAGTHLVGDIRPQAKRNRVDSPTLRGVAIQQLFGSQRALKTVEDFTEFEQRGAYFDGDQTQAAKKGVNALDRASQVQNMAEFQEMLDFPPAPKLDAFGRLVPAKATVEELRGEALFYGKAQCATCHTGVHFTDNTMHDLEIERFYTPRTINGLETKEDGPIKTFPLRGIKESPPYLHDGRLLTLDDTVELFNIVLGLRLSDDEKQDLVAFLCAL